MYFPARLTTYFELHYVLEGLKQVSIIEKANMSELDAWVCAALIAKAVSLDKQPNQSPDLKLVMAEAEKLGITQVRWNKLSRYDNQRASVFIFGDVNARGLFLKGKPLPKT